MKKTSTFIDVGAKNPRMLNSVTNRADGDHIHPADDPTPTWLSTWDSTVLAMQASSAR